MAFKAIAWGAGASLTALEVASWLPTSTSLLRVTMAFGVLAPLLVGVLVLVGLLRGRQGAVACLVTLAWIPLTSWALLGNLGPELSAAWSCVARASPGPGGLTSGTALGLVAWAVVVIASAGSMVPEQRPARLDAAVRAGARLCLLLVGFTTAAALARGVPPGIDTYLPSLPVVRTLAPGQSFRLADGATVTYRTGVCSAAGAGAAGTCALDGIARASFRAPTCPALTLHHDAAADLWVATVEGGGTGRSCSTGASALRATSAPRTSRARSGRSAGSSASSSGPRFSRTRTGSAGAAQR